MGTADLDWPDELDALTAAPTNHQLLLENDRVVDGETLLRHLSEEAERRRPTCYEDPPGRR